MAFYIANNPKPEATTYGFIITKLAFKKRIPNVKWRAARASTNESLVDFFEDYELSSYIDLKVAESSIRALSSNLFPVEIRLTQPEVAAILSEVTNTDELPDNIKQQYL